MTEKTLIALFLFLQGAVYFLRDQIIIALYYAPLKPPEHVQKQRLSKLDPVLKNKLTAYLQIHFQTSEEFVITKFKGHDILFLDKMHRARHEHGFINKTNKELTRRGLSNLQRKNQFLVENSQSCGRRDNRLFHRY